MRNPYAPFKRLFDASRIGSPESQREGRRRFEFETCQGESELSVQEMATLGMEQELPHRRRRGID